MRGLTPIERSMLTPHQGPRVDLNTIDGASFHATVAGLIARGLLVARRIDQLSPTAANGTVAITPRGKLAALCYDVAHRTSTMRIVP